METKSTVSAVEIVMSWKGSVLETDLVELARPRAVLVGSEGAVRFLVPEEALPARSAEILSVEDGRIFLRAPAGATLVAGKDGETIPTSLDASGLQSVEIVPGVTGEVKIGDFAFFARLVGALEEAKAPAALDFQPLRWIGAAVAFHAVLLGTFLFTPPNASAMNLDLSRSDARYIEAHLTPPVPIAELLPPSATSAAGGSTGSDSDPSPAPAPGGGTGGTVAATSGGHGRPTAHSTESPVVTAHTVNNLAMFGAMASLFANDGPDSGAFGVDSLEEGPGGPGAYLDLVSGENGPGGPGVHGVGIGTCTGADCGHGTLAVGPIGPRPGPIGPGPGLHGREGAGAPSVDIPPPAATIGGLGREEVRTTVRRHRNDVYSCYEAALRSNPTLEGRVTVAFQIDTSGVVRSANVVSTDGNVGGIASCVVDRIEHWGFPTAAAPTGVTAYPFVFHTGE